MSISDDTVTSTAHQAFASGRRAATQGWDRLANQGADLRDEARAAAERAGEAVYETADQVRTRLNRLTDRTRGYVEQEPVRALWMAVAVGAAAMALAGWLARDRRWR